MKKDQTESEDSFIESEIYPIIKFKIGCIRGVPFTYNPIVNKSSDCNISII